MASDSPLPDDNPPLSALEPTQAVMNDPQTTSETPKEVSSKSVFVNSQPVREEQVQNAVKFLSHPRVRGSPVLHRRNFLEKKGLTKEEIDEAFRRVPDPSPAATSGQSGIYQDAQVANIQAQAQAQAQAPLQVMQPIPNIQHGVMSTMARKFHWSHAFLAVGFLAISGAGAAIVFTNSLIPRLKSWIRQVVDEDEFKEKTAGKTSLAKEAAAAAKAAATAAADVAKSSREMLIIKNEEKKCFTDFMSLLDVQLQEMRTMRNTITKLEGQSHITRGNHVRDEYIGGSVAHSVQQMDNKSESAMKSVTSVSPSTSAEPPHPKSFMEIMAMVQRGERPPNVRDIDDSPPNPNQPISNPSLAPRPKPWEVNQPASNSPFTSQSQITTRAITYTPQHNGVTYDYNYDNSTPLWQQKNAGITEIENGNSQKFSSASNDTTTTSVGPTRRRWVPPQPPPVSMPEAAVAIRQPKSNPKDVDLKSEEETVHLVNKIDELERIIKISESGGERVDEINGGGDISEINETQEQVTVV